MQRRIAMIGEKSPVLSVSIHQNSYQQDASVHGPQVFYYESSEEGKKLAAIHGQENVFDFSLGNPNVPAPQIVKDAIVELVNDTDPVVLHGYTNSNSGYPEVREAIAKSLNERFDTKFSGKNIVMTVGAAGGLNVILKSLINPGDEVIAFAPYFGEYRSYTNNYDGVLIEISPEYSLIFSQSLMNLSRRSHQRQKLSL